MKYLIGTITISGLMLFGATATAQAVDIESDATCCSFIQPAFTQEAGETPRYVNPADGDASHNVTSTTTGPDGGPLFISKSIPPGKSAPVEGGQYLSDGTYPFICSIHPSMTGDLIISGGTPQVRPKPAVSLTIPAQKLKAVRKSGKLKVKVKGVSATSKVSLAVSKGSKKLGSASGITVAEGKSKTVSVNLTGKGKKAIKNGKKVAFKVKATVKGGKPASASRTLR